MAGRVRFLLERDGRYYARKVVPIELRNYLKTTELRMPLGADRRIAIRSLPLALVSIDAKLDAARQLAISDGNRLRPTEVLAPGALAKHHYQARLALDELLRNSGQPWASLSIDDGYVASVRAILAGRARDSEIREVFGDVLERYRNRGNVTVESGTPQWREYSRALADAELEVLARMCNLDEGIASASLAHPAHLAPPTEAEVEIPDEPSPVSLRSLLEDHLQYLEASGRGKAARKAWPRVMDDLLVFVADRRGLKGRARAAADDARKLTPDELIAWRDAKLGVLSSKTVKDVWMASIKSVLRHALEDRKIDSDPSAIVKVRHTPAPKLRDKGYSDSEALKILRACQSYVSPTVDNPANRESEHLTHAKRWAPWLCAFSGARIGEVAQLRKQDIRQEGGIWFMRLTPEAGRIKTRAYRDVPLHPQLVELGFLKFVDALPAGPLFFDGSRDPVKAAEVVSGKISTWLRKSGLGVEGVAPSHGWRHRFKTATIDLSADPRVVEAIQGHAGRTAADHYGSVSLQAKLNLIERLPRYAV